jgi:methionine-rich copper-binding protein CopC
MRRLSLPLLCTLGYALALCAGCGGDEAPRPDGGTPYVPPIPDAGTPDAGTSGPVDLIPPSLTGTVPANNAIAVPPESTISVTFSEAMRTNRGVLQITPNNVLLQGKPENWDTAKRTATFTVAGGLPLTKKLTVNLVDFADLAGNPLPTPANFTFTVSDGKPPRVTASTPAEGAAQVALSTSVATFTFNEPMDTTAGTLTAGGGLSIGTPAWASDKLQLSVPISGLVNPGNYSIRLQGFRNLIGKALDETTYLGDGKLDFGTGPDITPPTVTEASPSEGATEVPADSTSLLVVNFNEPMGTAGTATLVNVSTNARTTLTPPQWAADGFSVTYDVLDRLSPGVAMRVEFVGLKDRAGNALSPAPYLGDGKLDFSTAIDRTKPAIIASDPVEGTSDVYPNEVYVKAGTPATTGLRKVITLEFNEPMDTSITGATLYSPTNGSIPPRALTGVWAANRRTLTITILPPPTGGPPLEQLRSYALDLTNHKDPSGNLLDAAHPLLGDGELDFSTSSNDPVLNQACDDMLLKTVTSVTATSNPNVSTPRADVLRQRYELTLPASGSQFQGFTRFVPGTNALYSAFLSKSTLTVLTNPSTGDFIDVTQGATPAACPGGIVYRVDFGSSSLPELRMRFGPTADQKFQFVTIGTL